MVKEGGGIAHRYSGEDDLPQRAAKAGAHFSLIEENIAVADNGAHVHQGWMKSQAHHDNMLNLKSTTSVWRWCLRTACCMR